MIISKSEQIELLIYSVRYVLYRQTYAVRSVQDVIIRNWYELSSTDKKLIQSEILEAKNNNKLNSIDYPKWIEILELPR